MGFIALDVDDTLKNLQADLKLVKTFIASNMAAFVSFDNQYESIDDWCAVWRALLSQLIASKAKFANRIQTEVA